MSRRNRRYKGKSLLDVKMIGVLSLDRTKGSLDSNDRSLKSKYAGDDTSPRSNDFTKDLWNYAINKLDVGTNSDRIDVPKSLIHHRPTYTSIIRNRLTR